MIVYGSSLDELIVRNVIHFPLNFCVNAQNDTFFDRLRNTFALTQHKIKTQYSYTHTHKHKQKPTFEHCQHRIRNYCDRDVVDVGFFSL